MQIVHGKTEAACRVIVPQGLSPRQSDATHSFAFHQMKAAVDNDILSAISPARSNIS